MKELLLERDAKATEAREIMAEQYPILYKKYIEVIPSLSKPSDLY
jgi:hypothetical protein